MVILENLFVKGTHPQFCIIKISQYTVIFYRYCAYALAEINFEIKKLETC